jgi:hypothetical protein
MHVHRYADVDDMKYTVDAMQSMEWANSAGEQAKGFDYAPFAGGRGMWKSLSPDIQNV